MKATLVAKAKRKQSGGREKIELAGSIIEGA